MQISSNSSSIVVLAIGQILRSTERISSLLINCVALSLFSKILFCAFSADVLLTISKGVILSNPTRFMFTRFIFSCVWFVVSNVRYINVNVFIPEAGMKRKVNRQLQSRSLNRIPGGN